jgi:hypothetical protein
MMSALEYLLLMMMTSQPDASATATLTKIEPSSGDVLSRESFVIKNNGQIAMRTILMEPRDMMAEKLEAPVRISPDLLPLFKVGSPLSITVDDTGAAYKARIARIESITDASGSSIQVIAELDRKPEELQPGMIGTAIMTALP